MFAWLLRVLRRVFGGERMPVSHLHAAPITKTLCGRTPYTEGSVEMSQPTCKSCKRVADARFDGEWFVVTVWGVDRFAVVGQRGVAWETDGLPWVWPGQSYTVEYGRAAA